MVSRDYDGYRFGVKDTTMPTSKKLLRTIVLSIAVAAICLVIVAASSRSRTQQVTITLPDGSGRVTFEQTHIHEYFAEYDRRVMLSTEKFSNVECLLPTNVGGRTEMNVYWYALDASSARFLRLQDFWGEYLIDLDEGRSRSIVRVNGAAYVGDIRTPYSDSLIAVSEAGERTVYIGESQNELLDDRIANSPGTYLGRIDGTARPLRFVPALEESEKAIEVHPAVRNFHDWTERKDN